MSTNINDGKYIIHFKAKPSENRLVNLSEENNFTYTLLKPTSYNSYFHSLETEELPTASIDISDYGIGFAKNISEFSPFISLTNMTSYIDNNEDFTMYFRVRAINDGLGELNLDLFNTTFPGGDESSSSSYFKFGIYDGNLEFVANNNGDVFSFEYNLINYIEVKQYHIALSRTNNIVRAYIDGIKIFESSQHNDAPTYSGPIFFDSGTEEILNVYLGCNTNDVKIYFDDITIFKGFSFYGFFNFVVPDDIFAAKNLARIISSNYTYHDDTARDILAGQYGTKRKTLKPVTVINSTVLDLVNIRETVHVKTARKISKNMIVKGLLKYRPAVSAFLVNYGEREVVVKKDFLNSTEREVIAWKRKALAFVINPKYSKKGV